MRAGAMLLVVALVLLIAVGQVPAEAQTVNDFVNVLGDNSDRNQVSRFLPILQQFIVDVCRKGEKAKELFETATISNMFGKVGERFNLSDTVKERMNARIPGLNMTQFVGAYLNSFPENRYVIGISMFVPAMIVWLFGLCFFPISCCCCCPGNLVYEPEEWELRERRKKRRKHGKNYH